MAIYWGIVFGSGNYQGRFGVEFSISLSETLCNVTETLYYQTRFKVTDDGNNFWVDWDSYADSHIGAVSIRHPSNSSWSSSNITRIGSWSATFERKEFDQTGYFSARCSGIEYGGNGSDYFSFTIPALEIYRVTYNSNGGTGEMPVDEVDYGEAYVTRECGFTRDGYAFVGWNESPDGTGVDWTGDIGKEWIWAYRRSVTLYAIWEEKKNLMAINENDTWKEGTVYLNKVSGTPCINIDGTWRKGGA